MSHSSRDQPSCCDQSPEERQGPAVQTISPAISSRARHRRRTGFASRTVTLAPSGGRNRRIAITALIFSLACSFVFSARFSLSSHALSFVGLHIFLVFFRFSDRFASCLTSGSAGAKDRKSTRLNSSHL